MELLLEIVDGATGGFEAGLGWVVGGVSLREGFGLKGIAFRAGIRTLAGRVEIGLGSYARDVGSELGVPVLSSSEGRGPNLAFGLNS